MYSYQAVDSGSIDCVQDRTNDVVRFGVRHAGEDRQRETSVILVFCDREIAGLVSEGALIERLQVERDEMDAAGDTLSRQRRDKFAAIHIQTIQPETQNVEMPRRFPTFGDARVDEFFAGRKGCKVAGRDGCALLAHAIAFA